MKSVKAAVVEPRPWIEPEDLAACIAARNAGRNHWAEDLLDEKIKQLKSVGVQVEIRTVQ